MVRLEAILTQRTGVAHLFTLGKWVNDTILLERESQ